MVVVVMVVVVVVGMKFTRTKANLSRRKRHCSIQYFGDAEVANNQPALWQ